ncbi:hypothetical protein VT03_27665 [Planctomyces sp. SH-PL14]|jgi:hypothetical protein|nr:hypothetical protein VT03_27665 [Planctomyces sp. SH-PL14]
MEAGTLCGFYRDTDRFHEDRNLQTAIGIPR